MDIYIVQTLEQVGYEVWYEVEGAFSNKKEAFKNLISVNDDTRRIVVFNKENKVKEYSFHEVLKNYSLTNQQVLERLKQGKSVWLNNHTEIKNETELKEFTLKEILNATFISR